MFSKRYLLAVLAVAAIIAVAPMAFAGSKQIFDQKAFEAAQAAGHPILLDVTAPWCPTCKAQAPILEKLTADPKFRNLVKFEIDFDTRKDVLKNFNVRTQSTLIVFKGKSEAGRSAGDTNEASIAALLNKAL